MNRFNLTFSGEILPGQDPAQVRLRFGELFAIDDPARLERFFSGETVILRRNLNRKAAAEYYLKTHNLGVATELVKVTATEAAVGDAEKEAARQAAQRKAAEEAAHKRALEEEQRRQEAEEIARQRARVEAARRRAEQEAERQAALELEARRQAEEEAARQQALELAVRRQAEEAAERARARELELRREAEEEAARQRELAEQARREAAEEAARLEAEREAEHRRLAEEAAVRAAREQAEKARAEREAASQLEQEEAARRKAQKEAERRRLAREKAARRRAEKAERARAAEEKARAMAAQAAAREAQRQEKLKQREAQRQREEEAAAQLRASEEQREILAAQTLSRAVAARPGAPGMELGPGPSDPDPALAGSAPNLFALRPFRNTPRIRERANLSRNSARRAFIVAALSLAALLAVAARLYHSPPLALISGAEFAVQDERGGLWLLAGDKLLHHDRAGIARGSLGLEQLGLVDITPPLLALPGGDLLLRGHSGTGSEAGGLLRCPPAAACSPFGDREFVAGSALAAAYHPRSGSLFLADPAAGELLKLSGDGATRAGVGISLPARPVLRVHAGLLFMNSPDGPAISVLRPEDHAIGQQLDEVLLLPPEAVAAEQTRVADFLWVGENWWVTLYNPDTLDSGLYRFDEQWNYLARAPLAGGTRPDQLVAWGERVLVRDDRQATLQRFGPGGAVEKPFVSAPLAEMMQQQQQGIERSSLLRRVGLGLLALLTVAGLCLGRFHQLRSLVYRKVQSRGAEPLDHLAGMIRWILPARGRGTRIAATCLLYLGCGAALLAAAVAGGASAPELGALLLALGGPASALYLFARSPGGQLGVVGDRLLLVDHANQYHLGGGPRVQYHDHFLMVDDVIVFTGNPLLPGFDRAQIARHVAPIARTGIRVDGATVAVKLLQSRHPLALGTLATGAAVALACIVLLL